MNLPEGWTLVVEPKVAKEARRFPKRDREVVKEAIRVLPVNPHAGDIQKMKGEADSWRRRIGSYRIYYSIQARERIILVYHVERRTSTTY